jgi:cyd operon protein YbgT
MWYFSWILGTGFALAFGVLNAIWYEITDLPGGGEPESHPQRPEPTPPPAPGREP